MKFTLSALKQHLDTNASLDDICAKLNQIGLEVEEIENPADKINGFVVGQIVKIRKHPEADRLNLCTVDIGKGNDHMVEVVCGASNVYEGLKTVYASTGTYIPGHDFTLKKTKIRGVESIGMLCSLEELCLAESSEGILDFSKDGFSQSKINVGDDVKKYLPLDIVIEIAITPNRGDCLGVYGIARDLAAAGVGTLQSLPSDDLNGIKVGKEGDCEIKVHFDFPKDNTHPCSIFTGRIIKNIKNGPSPAWLKSYLESIGQKSINAAVDVGNYVMHQFNRPMHVFDADQLKGDLTVGFAKNGEKFDALNEKIYELSDAMMVIRDQDSIHSLAGIMGGMVSSCQEDTTTIFLESAHFDHVNIGRTGRDLKLSSDSRYRFERGVDPQSAQYGLNMATKLIIDLCGDEQTSISDACITESSQHKNRIAPKQFDYDASLFNRMIGQDMDRDLAQKSLSALGFDPKPVHGNKDIWKIVVPSWRNDVKESADINEEILRIQGMDSIERKDVIKAGAEPFLSPSLFKKMQMRKALASKGFQEVVTWSFMNKDRASDFYMGDESSDLIPKDVALVDPRLVHIENPISSELSVMRPSIIPHMLEAIQNNIARGQEHFKFFELGPVFDKAYDHFEKQALSICMSGVKSTKDWRSGADEHYDVFDLKHHVQKALDHAQFDMNNLQMSNEGLPAFMHPYRSVWLCLGRKKIGFMGDIHPSILRHYDIKGNVSIAEIYVDEIPSIKQPYKGRTDLSLSPYQPVKRDLAFWVDKGTPVSNVLGSLKKLKKLPITHTEVFDIFEKPDSSEKSIALRVHLQKKDGTFTDEELHDAQDQITAIIAKNCNGRLRDS